MRACDPLPFKIARNWDKTEVATGHAPPTQVQCENRAMIAVNAIRVRESCIQISAVRMLIAPRQTRE